MISCMNQVKDTILKANHNVGFNATLYVKAV